MKAISVRQPWAWLIVHGFKPIENRTWKTAYRGPVLIHASKTMTEMDFLDGYFYAEYRGVTLPRFSELSLLCGGFVGQAHIIDCVTQHESPWFDGPFGFVMDRPKAYEEIQPYRGRLGLFEAHEIIWMS